MYRTRPLGGAKLQGITRLTSRAVCSTENDLVSHNGPRTESCVRLSCAVVVSVPLDVYEVNTQTFKQRYVSPFSSYRVETEHALFVCRC